MLQLPLPAHHLLPHMPMKKRLILLAAAWGTLLLAGCTIKTQHEIKPIHITMDVNVRLQQELKDVFGDIDKASETFIFETGKEQNAE